LEQLDARILVLGVSVGKGTDSTVAIGVLNVRDVLAQKVVSFDVVNVAATMRPYW